MKAAVLHGAASWRVDDVPMPEVGPTDVLVRMEGSGVCASNVPVWQGRPWFTYPLAPGAPGHEGWGIVEAIGEKVENVAPGARVAMISSHAYAEYDVGEAGALVPLPDALAATPLPGEPMACAVNVLDRINGPQPKTRWKIAQSSRSHGSAAWRGWRARGMHRPDRRLPSLSS